MEQALDTRPAAELSPDERRAIIASLLAKGLLRSRIETTNTPKSAKNSGSFKNLESNRENIA